MFFSNENENRDAVIAGAIARCTETTVWARPFVAPNIPFGAADETYMKIQPEVDGEERSENTHYAGIMTEKRQVRTVRHACTDRTHQLDEHKD